MSVSIRMRWVAAVCGSIVAASAFAQSEPPATPPEEPKPPTPAPAAEPPAPPKPKSTLGDPPLHRWGGLTLAVDVWGPQLANRDDDVAIVNDGVSTRLIDTPADASAGAFEGLVASSEGSRRDSYRVRLHEA